MRAFKTVNDSYIEPISFIVPRRAEVFQEDIYPPVNGLTPGLSSEEYFAGKDGLPPKLDLESVYSGSAPRMVASDYKPSAPAPAASPAPAPEPKKSEPVKETPQPEAAASRGPPPSMKVQGASMSDVASKFADKEESESDSENSSFEEVTKPTESKAAPAAAKIETPVEQKKEPEAAPSPAKAAMWKVSQF